MREEEEEVISGEGGREDACLSHTLFTVGVDTVVSCRITLLYTAPSLLTLSTLLTLPACLTLSPCLILSALSSH